MRPAHFLLPPSKRSIWGQSVSLLICYAVVSSCFVGPRATSGSSYERAAERTKGSHPGWPNPAPRFVDPAAVQKSRQKYVPPALRPDNAERRGNDKEGKRVDEPETKIGAPASNLPTLDESRRRRKSPKTEATSKRGFANMLAPGGTQSSLICADCDPGGGGGAGGSDPNDPYFGTARTRPINDVGDPGVTLGSRNFNWSLPIVTLPGRAGLDLSISLFYNSLVWTKQGNAIQYNADHGTPAPGFQIGLPRLQARYFNSDDNSFAYIMVMPSGSRVEMKQVGTSSTYESADSTYTQLTFSGAIPIVRTTDGTQYVFGTQAGAEWRCTKIEDRNGNFISATYNSSNGHILTVTDTLSRTIDFNYDATNNLSTITQTWAGVTRSWATFIYIDVPMSVNFPNLTAYGVPSTGQQTVLSFIAFPENTSYHFDYNSYGQVYQIHHAAPDGHELEHTFYNIDTSGTQTDCPRFTQRRDYAQDWNGSNEAVTTYALTNGATWTTPETGVAQTGTLVEQTAPDGTIYREYSHTSGWDAGLTQLTEVWSGGSGNTKKKWNSTTWTQDNTGLSYPQNPRVPEINIYDDGGNRRRTTIDFSIPSYAQFGLPYFISEYAADGVTEIRRSYTDYNLDSAYISRRLIGLVSAQHVLDPVAGAWQSKVTYGYDDPARIQGQATTAPGHDPSYDASFTVRGNQTAFARWDANDIGNAAKALISYVSYDAAGSVLSSTDAAGHTGSIGYADSFSDSVNRNTFAYPTSITDAQGNSSTAQYNYDFGAVTRTHAPTSGTGGGTTYVDVVRQYDVYGRLDRITNQTNNAYTHFVYETNANYVHTYQTILDLTQANEFHSWQVLDGAGRVRASASDHPGSTGLYQGQYVIYDNMGRVIAHSNPTEIDQYWNPSGDDSLWRQTTQAYDWKGRPTETVNTDGTTRVVSYGGCGCAGGEVTTVQDEHLRQRRFTKDVLGRLATVQEMIWNTGNVYSTTSYTYNARDQIKQTNQAAQIRTFDYDGYGRLQTRFTPEQGTTSYSYNPDDTTNVVTDARGVTTNFSYNPRHLVTGITYNVSGDPTGQARPTNDVSFGYDDAGNRTSMSDGLGTVSYGYNNLAQLTSETRHLDSLGTNYTLSYSYNLAGELSSVTNPWSVQVGYGYDKAGRLTNVSGAGYAGVSSYASSLSYRAFGAIKGMSYGNGRSLSTAYDNRLRPTTWNVSNVLGYNYNYDYLNERTGRVSYAQSINDATLDRSFEYDNLGRLAVSHSGTEARAHAFSGQWTPIDGPYSQGYIYDVWGNVTHRYGWGGEVHGDGVANNGDIYYSYTGNRRNGFSYDAAGNLTGDGLRTYAYDATGQQTSAVTSGGGGGAPNFADDPLKDPNNPESFKIKALHITQLRTAINQVRTSVGLGNYSWTYSVTTSDYISANPIIEMRMALNEALGAPASPGYAADLAQNQPILAVHIQELRNRVTTALGGQSTSSLYQSYDGAGLRVKKVENGATTFYLRSSVLGGQIVAEINGSATWQRGFVYAGSSLLAVQQGGVFWMHEDPVTKSKRVTDVNGSIVSAIELDPWGADTNRSSSAAFQPRKFTSYDRDANGGDEAMFRRFNRKHSRFDQPDPYDGSYDSTDPQSFNRYTYVQNDPVNFVDPNGLNLEDAYAPSRHTEGTNPMGFMGPGIHPGRRTEWENIPTLVVFGAQGPVRRGDDDIYTKIAPNLKPVAKALGEYQDCVKANPRAGEYRDKISVAAVKSAMPLPSKTSAGRAAFNGSRAYQAGRAVFTFANVYKPLLQGAVFTLLVNSVFFSADAELLRKELLAPWEEDCKQKIQGKYGFRP